MFAGYHISMYRVIIMKTNNRFFCALILFVSIYLSSDTESINF